IPLPLRTAVDIALHDLFGKLTGRTVRSIFGITDTVEALCSYTLGFSTVDELLARVEEAKDFRLFKVKLGDANDKERVTALLNAGKTNFCVDANQAWTSLSQSMDWINWLADRGCLFVEQPMPVDMAKDYEQLYRSSSLPILLDESVQDLRDLEDLRGVCHGINVKLVKCGGLEPAVKLVRQANKAGLKVLLGCMSESSCGALAAAQLSGWADWIDLDGPRLIRNDPFGGARYVQGQLLLNAEAGTGAILQDATLFGD
ncbi:MAG: dipeptide epimerase, partial [Bacteroidia bacterium]|nr:dipeptide epimerase [Bacteroidia bacterium]